MPCFEEIIAQYSIVIFLKNVFSCWNDVIIHATILRGIHFQIAETNENSLWHSSWFISVFDQNSLN